MRFRYKIAIGVGIFIFLARANYKDPMSHWSTVTGTSWGADKPKSDREIYKEGRIKKGFVPYNKGHNNVTEDGYETFEVIRKTQYPGGYEKLDIKHKIHSRTLDITDPGVADDLEDEYGK
jgi:hypothetical protein